MNRLNWTFSTLGCPELSLKEALLLARKHGLSMLEIRALEGQLDLPAIFEKRYGSTENLREYLDDSGFRVIALDASLKLIGNGPEDRAEFLNLVHWAEGLGVPYLRVFDGGASAAELSQEDIEMALETVAWWRGIRGRNLWQTDIMVEIHDALTTSNACLQFENSLSEPVPLLWDTHHTWKKGGKDPEKTWLQLKPFVRHIHVKDSISAPSARHPYTYTFLGKGEFPIEKTINMLATDGFNYPVSIEWEKKWHPYLPSMDEALEKVEKLGYWQSQ